jgi:aldose sugar dehydrogenase
MIADAAAVGTGVEPRVRARTVALAWWVVSWAAVILMPAHFRFGALVWGLPPDQFIEALAVGTAFLVQAVFLANMRRPSLWRALLLVVVSTAVLFGAVLLLLAFYPRVEPSRLFFASAFLLALGLSALPFLLDRLLLPATVVLLLALILEVALGAKDTLERTAELTVEDKTVTTTLHRLSIDYYAVPQNPANVSIRGGGIVAYGKDFLIVTGAGEVFHARWDADGALQFARMPFAVPMEQDAYAADKNHYNDALLIRVTGIVLDPSVPRRLFVSYDHWYREKNCFTTRVASIDLDEQLERTAQAGWRQVFEAQPCIPVSTGFDNLQTGGRLAVTADGKLLLSLGDHGINGLNSPALSQDPANDYGKVLILDRAGGRSILSIGHRNPQGLLVDSGGRIWETEHGPQGGDEINLLTAGGNYGWPKVTYGADYGYETWPFSPPQARDHGEFVEPLYAFLPSVGVSNLIELKGEPFVHWSGDLLVASLRAESLFRVRLHGETLVYVERIPIGRRVRDLVQGADGGILLWTDAGDVEVLKAAAAPTIYERCSGCHEASGGIKAFGPSLRGVVERRIASEFEYPYSQALSQMQGIWSEDKLDEFIRSPSTFAPGTKMNFNGVADPEERAAIIRFLRHYHNVPH